jgi:Cro/C1-type helix-turn-helix DNA-binding protein
MLAEMKKQAIQRINHVERLCRDNKWDKKRFMKEAVYHTDISDTTLEKAYAGETDLSMNVVEQLAKLFDVTKDEVLESVW